MDAPKLAKRLSTASPTTSLASKSTLASSLPSQSLHSVSSKSSQKTKPNASTLIKSSKTKLKLKPLDLKSPKLTRKPSSTSTSSPSPNPQAKKTNTKKISATEWKAKVTVNLECCTQPLIKQVVIDLGYTITDNKDKSAFILWYTSQPPAEVISGLQSYQRVNHFPASTQIARKDRLARNLDNMRKASAKDYDFAPMSWILPAEMSSLRKHYASAKQRNKHPTYIYKPPNLAQGKGILLARTPDELPNNDGQTVLVQEYLSRPYLIDGFKFDLRLYVLVTSYEPLRVFLYRDGLVRLSTTPYKAPTAANISKVHMHLTNFSLNKDSADFDDNESTGEGSKRSIKWMMGTFEEEGIDTEKLWEAMADVVNKTLIVAWPHNVHAYKIARTQRSDADPTAHNSSNCFAVLGFDVFLDKNLKPYIIEVNKGPSFATGSPLDHEIKYGVISSAIKLLKLRPSQKVKSVNQSRSQTQDRLLRGTSGSSASSSQKHSLTNDSTPSTFDAEIEAERLRVEYETRCQGDYRRIFPDDNSVKQQNYQQLIGLSTEIFFAKGGTDVSSSWQSPSKTKPSSPTTATSTTKRTTTTLPPVLHPPSKANTPQRVASGPIQGVHRMATTAASSLQRGVSTRGQQSNVHYYETFMTELAKTKISCPDHTTEETLLEVIKNDWYWHSDRVHNYWVFQLDQENRVKVIEIVTTKVKQTLLLSLPIEQQSDNIGKNRLWQVLCAVADKLASNNGQGLWNFLDTTRSRQSALSNVITSKLNTFEVKACRRLVELCEQCLLVVYMCSTSHERPPSV